MVTDCCLYVSYNILLCHDTDQDKPKCFFGVINIDSLLYGLLKGLGFDA